jgi:hypothetical protein
MRAFGNQRNYTKESSLDAKDTPDGKDNSGFSMSKLRKWVGLKDEAPSTRP